MSRNRLMKIGALAALATLSIATFARLNAEFAGILKAGMDEDYPVSLTEGYCKVKVASRGEGHMMLTVIDANGGVVISKSEDSGGDIDFDFDVPQDGNYMFTFSNNGNGDSVYDGIELDGLKER